MNSGIKNGSMNTLLDVSDGLLDSKTNYYPHFHPNLKARFDRAPFSTQFNPR